MCVEVRKQTAQCTLSNAEAVACGVRVHVYVVNADVCVCVCVCVYVHVCMFVYVVHVVCVVYLVSSLCAQSRSLSKMTTHTCCAWVSFLYEHTNVCILIHICFRADIDMYVCT